MAARQMTLRQADAALAERYLHWRWVSGSGPVGFGGWESDWLLPEDMHLPDVRADQWELLDDHRKGKFTIKSLPAFTTDIAAAWVLTELLDEVEMVKKDGRWRCRIGEVVQIGETGALALSRALFQAGQHCKV